VHGQDRAGHRLQDTRTPRGQAAQGELLSRTARRSVRGEDDGGTLRLSRGPLLRENPSGTNVAIISYDDKPGIQTIGNTVPDLPPQPGSHPAFARDHENKRHGKDRHRSREFIGFLEKLDAAYPTDTAIKVILDNHSAQSPRRPMRGSIACPKSSGQGCRVRRSSGAGVRSTITCSLGVDDSDLRLGSVRPRPTGGGAGMDMRGGGAGERSRTGPTAPEVASTYQGPPCNDNTEGEIPCVI
jgi:hypothetical protein